MADEALVINLETQLDEQSVRRDIKKLEKAHEELHKKLITQQNEYNKGRKSSATIGDIKKTKTELAKNTAEIRKYKTILLGISKIQQETTQRIIGETKAIKARHTTLNKTNGVVSRQSKLLSETGHITEKLVKSEKRLTDERRSSSNIFKSAASKINASLRERIALLEQLIKKNKKVRASTARGTGTANGREGFAETMFGGAGTTFGHKIATTAQYATAGAGIYALASAFRAGAEAVVEFDTATRTLSAVLSISHLDAKVLGQDLNDLGKAYGGTLKDIYGVTNALGRAGVATKDLVAGTEIVIKMAKLTGDTFDQATSALVSYSQVFGKDEQGNIIYTMEELGDKLANVANASRMSTQDIGTFSNYALAAAKSVGLSLDAVSGLAIAFSNAGVNASTAGTQVRRFTSLLLDDGKAATNLFDKLGIVQTNFVHDMKKSTESSNTAMEAFVTKLKSLSDEEFLDVVQGMDLLATNSLNLIRNNSDAFIGAMRNSYNGVKGELQAVETIIGGVTSSWERFKNTIADTTVDILNAGDFLGTVTDLLVTYGEGVGAIFSSDIEKQIFRTTTSIRFLKRELRDDDLSPARKTEIEKELLRHGHRIDSMTKQKQMLEELDAEEKRLIETKRVTVNLNDAILNSDKELIEVYTKKLKLLQDTEKEKKKSKGDPKSIIPPKIDTSIMLKSIQALDAAGLDTTTTFINLSNSVESFKKVTEGKVGALTDSLEKTGIVNKSLTGDALESQTNLLNLLADGGKQLSKNSDKRTHQIGIIKRLIKLYEGVITQENLVTQAITITSKSRAAALKQTLKQEQASAKLNDHEQTALGVYAEQVALLDKSLIKAKDISAAKVREETSAKIILEKTKLTAKYQSYITKLVESSNRAFDNYQQAFDPFYDYTSSQAYTDLQKQIADLKEAGESTEGLELKVEMQISNLSKFFGITEKQFASMASSSITSGIQDALDGQFDFGSFATSFASTIGTSLTTSMISSMMTAKTITGDMWSSLGIGVGLMAISSLFTSDKARQQKIDAKYDRIEALKIKQAETLQKSIDELVEINQRLSDRITGKGTKLAATLSTDMTKRVDTIQDVQADADVASGIKQLWQASYNTWDAYYKKYKKKYDKAEWYEWIDKGTYQRRMKDAQKHMSTALDNIAVQNAIINLNVAAKQALKEHAEALLDSIDSILEFNRSFQDLSDSLSGTSLYADQRGKAAVETSFEIFGITTEEEFQIALDDIIDITAWENAEQIKIGLASDVLSAEFAAAMLAVSGLNNVTIDAINHYDDLAIAVEYLNKLEVARLHSLENEAAWLNLFKTDEQLAIDMMNALSDSTLVLATDMNELDALFIKLRDSNDELTDAELAFLEANRDLIITAEELADTIEASEANIKSWLDSWLTAEELAQNMANTLGVTVATNIKELNTLFEQLAYDTEGLTDAELELLNANKALIEATEALAKVSEDNIKSWLDSWLTAEELAQNMANTLGVTVATSFEELDTLFLLLSEDADGLTNAELELLNANKDLITTAEELAEATDSVNDSLLDLAEGLEGLVISAEEQIAELLNVGATPTEDLYGATTRLQDLNKEFLTFFDEEGLLYPESFDDMSTVFNELLNLTGEVVGMEGLSTADQEAMAVLFAGQLDDAIDLFDASVDVLQVAIISTGGLAEDATLVDMMTWLSNLFLESGLDVPAFASGGIITEPTIGLIGEAGYSEAVIPLKNPDDPMGTRALLEELQSMKAELSDMKQLQIKQTADGGRQLSTTRALLDETINQGA